MSLYQVILKGSYQGQLVINAPSFITNNEAPETSTAFGLATGMGYIAVLPNEPQSDSFLEAYLGAQTDIFHLDEIMVRNLYDVNDFYTVALSGAGWNGTNPAGADGEVSFVASKLQTNRVRTDINRGSMALTPLTEESYSADGTVQAGGMAALQLVCDRLNEPISTADGEVTTDFIPAVISKEKRAVPGSSPVRYAYYFYETEAEQLEHVASGVTWNVKNRATSQVSRKIGKGA